MAETLELADRAPHELLGLALLEELGAKVGVELARGQELMDDLQAAAFARGLTAMTGTLMASAASNPPVLRA